MVCRSLYVLLLWSWYRRKAWAEEREGREPVGVCGGGELKGAPDPVPRELTCLERWRMWFCCCGRGVFFNLFAGMCGAVSEGVDSWCSRQRDYWEGESDAQTELQKVLQDIEAQREEDRISRMSKYEADEYRLQARNEDVSAQKKASDEPGRYANVLPDWQRSLLKVWRWPPSGESEAQRTVNTLHEDIEAQCEEAQVLISIIDRTRGEGETAQASTGRLEKLRKVHHDATLVSQK